jgi:hypothetical protein
VCRKCGCLRVLADAESVSHGCHRGPNSVRLGISDSFLYFNVPRVGRSTLMAFSASVLLGSAVTLEF